MANAMQYIANLGKSVIYSGVDQIKANNPAIAELAEQNAQNIVEALLSPFVEQLDSEYQLEIH